MGLFCPEDVLWELQKRSLKPQRSPGGFFFEICARESEDVAAAFGAGKEHEQRSHRPC